MLIKLEADGLCTVPVVSGEPIAPHLTEKNKLIVLFPGWNEIKPEYWAIVQPHLKDGIESGKFVLRTKRDATGETDGIEAGIDEIRADIARDVIKGCYNLDNLKAWQNDTKLTGELRALADIQLKACEEGKSPESRS